MLKKYISVVVLIFVTLVSVGCSNFTENAVKTADVTTLAADTVRKAYANNYEKLIADGKLTVEQDQEIEKAYNKYTAVAKSAVMAIRVYHAKEMLKANPSKDEVNKAMAELSATFTAFYDMFKVLNLF